MGRSDRNSQVIQMWQDLWKFFEKNPENNKEYFLGSMVIIADKEKVRTFQVIDGQQRLTTLLLLFSAMRCMLLDQQKTASPDMQNWYTQAVQTLERFIFNPEGRGFVKHLKLKIERTIGMDYNAILSDAVHCRKNDEISRLPLKFRAVAERYFRNRDYLSEQLKSVMFSAQGVFDSSGQDRFEKFFRFLEQRVAIVQIMTTEFDTAWGIFEILNNRGLPLSNLDLLRNFVLNQLSEAGHQDGDAIWDNLERRYDLVEAFGGRWAESRVAQSLSGSAFNELKKIYADQYAPDLATGREKIDVFVNDLEDNLRWYNIWANAEHSDQIPDRKTRNALAFIKLLGNERYSANLFLALFRCCQFDGSVDRTVHSFISSYRSYAAYTYLLGRHSADSIYTAIRALNGGDVAKAQSHFILTADQRKSLHQYFDDPIRDNDCAKRLLAACVWHQEEQIDDVVEQSLSFEKATLEHIIPQHPESASNWMTDFDEEFRQDFTYRLGNMTLLTQSKNAANRNFDFVKKQKIYEKTNLKMTLEIAHQSRLTKNFFTARQASLVQLLRTIFQ